MLNTKLPFEKGVGSPIIILLLCLLFLFLPLNCSYKIALKVIKQKIFAQ